MDHSTVLKTEQPSVFKIDQSSVFKTDHSSILKIDQSSVLKMDRSSTQNSSFSGQSASWDQSSQNFEHTSMGRQASKNLQFSADGVQSPAQSGAQVFQEDELPTPMSPSTSHDFEINHYEEPPSRTGVHQGPQNYDAGFDGSQKFNYAREASHSFEALDSPSVQPSSLSLQQLSQTKQSAEPSSLDKTSQGSAQNPLTSSQTFQIFGSSPLGKTDICIYASVSVKKGQEGGGRKGGRGCVVPAIISNILKRTFYFPVFPVDLKYKHKIKSNINDSVGSITILFIESSFGRATNNLYLL